MLEKIRAVNNPLTIIAIFAALAEIAGTIALATVEKELQRTFVWFVMAFPTMLVTAFFLTLNFNPKVLYAPSDFRNEENFISTVVGTRELSVDLAALTEQLESAKEEIIKQASERVSLTGDTERAKLVDFVRNQISRVQVRLETTKQAADLITEATGAVPHSELQARIVQSLSAESNLSLKSVAKAVGRNAAVTERAIDRLVERGVVIDSDPRGDGCYSLVRER